MMLQFQKVQQVKKVILLYDSDCTFNSLISKCADDALFKYICENYRFKNMMYPSKVYEFIHKNRLLFEKAFQDNLGEGIYNKVQRFIAALGWKTLDQIKLESRMYQSICSAMGLSHKNEKSRKLIYYYWKKISANIAKNKIEFKNESVSVTTPLVQEELVIEDMSLPEQSILHTFSSTPKEKIKQTDSELNEKSITETSLNVEHEITPEMFDIPQALNLSVHSSNETLPLNSKNVDMLPVTNYKHCTYFEGSLEITYEQYNTIVRDGKLIPEFYPFFIRNRIHNYINNTCSIVMKFPKYLKKGVIKLYGQCKNSNYKCKKFIILLNNLNIKVYSSSLNYSHQNKITLHVKGIERAIAKKSIYHLKPSEYKRKLIIEAKDHLIQKGNLQGIKSDCTFRKIKSEAMAHLDRDINDITDIIKMQNDHSNYIQEVSVPFNVKVYSVEQLNVLKHNKLNNRLPLIYFDATGNIVKKPKNVKKKIYLYSAVMSLPTGRIFPLFEMISADHYSKTIFKIFNDFRIFAEEKGKWPIFQGVVTDFSFANLHAISKACNWLTLSEYIEETFQILTNIKKISSKLVTIHLCTAHVMKMFCKDIDDFFKDEPVKLFLKDVMAQGIKLRKLSELECWFSHLCILLSYPIKNNSLEQSELFFF